jgi:hypothetical protein
MIILPETTVEVLSRAIAPSNTPSFLWRKLSGSPTVNHLTKEYSVDQLLTDLETRLAKPQMNETDIVTAYATLVAALIAAPPVAVGLRDRIPALAKLYWSEGLVAFAPQVQSSTSSAIALQTRVQLTDPSPKSSGSTSQILIAQR